MTLEEGGILADALVRRDAQEDNSAGRCVPAGWPLQEHGALPFSLSGLLKVSSLQALHQLAKKLERSLEKPKMCHLSWKSAEEG